MVAFLKYRVMRSNDQSGPRGEGRETHTAGQWRGDDEMYRIFIRVER